MQSLIKQITQTLLTGAVVSVAIAVDAPTAKAFSLIQKDLFFERNIPSGGQVSEDEFQDFVDDFITPSFPDGLTIYDADGEEPSKVVSLFVEDTLETETNINQIAGAYLGRFDQESVLEVTNRDQLKVGFGAGENLIDNDPTPEFIQADLFFGRSIPDGGQVSEEQFQDFVDDFITPGFPDGLTIFDADGQFLDSTGTLIQEPSKVVRLLFDDTQENEDDIDGVITEYLDQFDQESVLLAVNEEVKVGFGAGENLIDNDPTPEFIQADLFFGRDIPGDGEVSEEDFQDFVDDFIAPGFPDRPTIFDADGQFLDSMGGTIEEQSKVARFLFEDTQANEDNLDGIITEYLDQFDQESVLLVVDEDVKVATVPEPSSVAGLLAAGVIGAILLKKKLKAV
jgi:transcription termination factor NusB